MTTSAPRTFTFTTIFASEIPAEALVRPAGPGAANALPFKDWFKGNLEATRDEGKMATLFVPFSYFTTPVEKGGRGIDTSTTKVDAGYVKAKLRDQFNAWQDETKKLITAATYAPSETRKSEKTGKDYTVRGKELTPEVATNEARGGLHIVMMERTGKEKALPGAKELGITEPGVQLWMKLTPEAKKALEEAKEAAEKNKS